VVFDAEGAYCAEDAEVAMSKKDAEACQQTDECEARGGVESRMDQFESKEFVSST